MKPPTDCIRHAAGLARQLQMDAPVGGTPQADSEFCRILSMALDDTAAGLAMVSARV